MKITTIFHTQFPPDKLDTSGGEEKSEGKNKKKNNRAKMCELWAGVGGRWLVICRAT